MEAGKDFRFTHAELVGRAEKWLRNSMRCNVILREFVCSASEIPDVIGWKGGRSILLECKTSRGDFKTEHKKPHRRHEKYNPGMGCERYYFVPAGLIDPHETPDMWGLLFCYGNHVKIVKEATPYPPEIFRVAEYPLLLSIARRVELRGLMVSMRDYGSVVLAKTPK